MSCITQLGILKGDRDYLPVNEHSVIEATGTYKGYEWLVTFQRFGHRCGYVAIPNHHHGDNVDVNCHGGITFSERNHAAKKLLPVHCDDLWIGFDAMHSGDRPCTETAKKYFGEQYNPEQSRAMEECFSDGEHRSLGYMINECYEIISQLIESQTEH